MRGLGNKVVDASAGFADGHKGKTQAPILRLLVGTTMPNPHLPQELLDHIIDLLDDDLETLKECSLVAKSWIPRTQKHIFATVEFTSTRDLQSWKRAFPNPSKSPACYTRSMYFGCPEAVVAADAEEGGWLRAFSHLANLHLESNHSYLSDGTRVGFAKSFAPFYVFSPTLKSLRVPPILFQSPDLWTLMHSSPLLENLGVTGHEERDDDDDDLFGPRTVVSSTSPPLTGSLDLHIFGGMGKIASELLELPSGLHFRSLILLLCHKGDVWWMTDLVERCFDTLECLEVTHRLDCTFSLILCHTYNSPAF